VHTQLGFFIKHSSCIHESSPVYCNILHRSRRYILRSKLEPYPGNVGTCQKGLGKATKTQCRQPTRYTTHRRYKPGKSRTLVCTKLAGMMWPFLTVTSNTTCCTDTGTLICYTNIHSGQTAVFTVGQSPAVCLLSASHRVTSSDI